MEITDEIFSKVVKMVESGFTIQQACKKINIDRGVFYYKISKNQKSILKQAKTSSSLMLRYTSGNYVNRKIRVNTVFGE